MDLKYDLNKKQRKGVTTTEGPVLVLAGAGSGKTRTATYRVAKLLMEGVQPDRIMMVTFTNKAADDMLEKIKSLVDDEEITDKIWIGTFHSLCLRILSINIDKIDGYTKNYLIYDSDDTKDLIKTVIKDLNLNTEIFDPDIITNIINDAKMNLIKPDRLVETKPEKKKDYYSTVATIYKEYEAALKENNAFDFNDLIKKTIELFNEHPDILEKYQHKFRYIQVDEYQDVNTSQYKIVNMLAKPQNNLFVVGDDFQSIYRFRGARVDKILDFKADYPNAEIIKLEQNYRSTQNIIKASNALIGNNDNQAEKDIWTDRKLGNQVTVCEANSSKSEALFVTKTIDNLVKCGYDYQDIAILYRSNAQSRHFESALMNYEIPHHIVGGTGFFNRKEVKDVNALLKLAVNPSDILSMTRVVNFAADGIGAGTIDKLHQHAQDNNLQLLDVMNSPQNVKGIGKKKGQKVNYLLSNIINKVLEIASSNKSLPDKVKNIIYDTDYLDVLRKDMETFESRKSNIKEFLNLAHNYYMKDKDRSLIDFVRDIKLMSDQDDLDEEEDNTVKLMTIHASKGLEFPIVFLVGMEKEMFPHQLCMDTKQEIEEERRLCYVGMTRAEDRLFLSHCQYRQTYKGLQRQKKSRFLEELPMQHTRKIKINKRQAQGMR